MFNTALRKLSGANLEVFKVNPTHFHQSHTSIDPAYLLTSLPSLSLQFGIYILFPIGWMYYFGTNLEERFAVPGFWPKPEQSHKIPFEREEIDKELERMKQLRAFKREREEMAAQNQVGEVDAGN